MVMLVVVIMSSSSSPMASMSIASCTCTTTGNSCSFLLLPAALRLGGWLAQTLHAFDISGVLRARARVLRLQGLRVRVAARLHHSVRLRRTDG